MFGQSYRLERIVVEGSRVPESIVRAESRLIEERTYSDEDFRAALDRIRRLPFVVDASYRVEPGFTAGSTTLVVSILDETRVFYDTEASFTRDELDTSHVAGGSVGAWFFFDDLGILEPRVQVIDDADGVSAGLTYRQYGLGGTSAFAFFSIDQRFGGRESFRYDPAPSLTLGYPLTREQTLTFVASRAKTRRILQDEDEDDDEDPPSERFDVRRLALQWSYDSSDDPLFPSRGTFLSFGPAYLRSRTTLEETDTKFHEYAILGEAQRHWRLPGQNVASVRVAGEATRLAIGGSDTDTGSLEAAARFAHDFHSHATDVLRPFRARLEVDAGYRRGILEGGGDQKFASVGFTLRHRLKTIRLTGTYEWD